jgi:hypothetical protein
MYFHRAGWPGDWIIAVRKLLCDEFDQSYCFREDVAQWGEMRQVQWCITKLSSHSSTYFIIESLAIEVQEHVQ